MTKTIPPSRQAVTPPFAQGRLQSYIRYKNIAILVAKDSFRLPCVERKAQAPRKCKHLLCCRRKVNEGLFCLCKLLFNKPFVYSQRNGQDRSLQKVAQTKKIVFFLTKWHWFKTDYRKKCVILQTPFLCVLERGWGLGGRGKLLARSFPLPPSPHPLSRTHRNGVCKITHFFR